MRRYVGTAAILNYLIRNSHNAWHAMILTVRLNKILPSIFSSFSDDVHKIIIARKAHRLQLHSEILIGSMHHHDTRSDIHYILTFYYISIIIHGNEEHLSIPYACINRESATKLWEKQTLSIENAFRLAKRAFSLLQCRISGAICRESRAFPI